MNRFSDPADQKHECLNGDYTGKSNGEDTCKWTPCNDVGYCVDSRDAEYFNEMVSAKEASTRRSLLVDADYGRRCPSDMPNPGDECSYQGSCEYVEVECCGKTYNTYIAQCDNGVTLVIAFDPPCAFGQPCDGDGYGNGNGYGNGGGYGNGN